MTPRRERLLIGLVLALLVLVGLNLWVEPSSDGDVEASPWSEAWPTLERSGIDRISLTGTGSAVTIERRAGGWHLAGADGVAADDRRVANLLNMLTRMRVGEPLDVDAREDHGLSPARRVVEAYGGEVLLASAQIGRDAPAGAGTYVQIGDTVYMTQSALGSELAEGKDYFRTREVVRFPRTAVTAVTIHGAAGRIELSRTDGEWVLGGSTPAPARAEAVEAFLEGLLDLRVENYGAAAGVPSSERLIQITTPSGTDELQVWQQGERWWANGSLHSGPVEITAGLGRVLPLSSDSWRLVHTEK